MKAKQTKLPISIDEERLKIPEQFNSTMFIEKKRFGTSNFDLRLSRYEQKLRRCLFRINTSSLF